MPKHIHTFFFPLKIPLFGDIVILLVIFIKSVLILIICYSSLKVLQSSGPLYLLFYDKNKIKFPFECYSSFFKSMLMFVIWSLTGSSLLFVTNLDFNTRKEVAP